MTVPAVPAVPFHGERLAVPERLIVAPGVGVFRRGNLDEGATVGAGDVVGEIVGPGTQLPVRSAFSGTIMGILAHPGERLREGQPVAWLRVR